MTVLGRLWTWIGHLFIPFAVGLAFVVRNGLFNESPSPGARVSYAYFGLLVTLAAGSALAWTSALYVRAAKEKSATNLLPPNTTFEEKGNRNQAVSVATIVIFTVSIIAALITFGTSYSESEIHRWDDQTPIQQRFYPSRVKAHEEGCSHQPCYAVGQRMGADKVPLIGVMEYILYVTDGALIALTLVLLGGVCWLLVSVFRVSKKPFM